MYALSNILTGSMIFRPHNLLKIKNRKTGLPAPVSPTTGIQRASEVRGAHAQSLLPSLNHAHNAHQFLADLYLGIKPSIPQHPYRIYSPT